MKPHRKQSPEQSAAAENALYSAIASLQSAGDVRAFMLDLCTPAELQALVDRWQVVRLLQEQLPYRRISDLTGVSVTTIGRVARFLADGYGGYRIALGRTVVGDSRARELGTGTS